MYIFQQTIKSDSLTPGYYTFNMGEVERCSPSRVLFTQDELANLDKDQLLQYWFKQENYINWIESQLSSAQIGLFPFILWINIL